MEAKPLCEDEDNEAVSWFHSNICSGAIAWTARSSCRRASNNVVSASRCSHLYGGPIALPAMAEADPPMMSVLKEGGRRREKERVRKKRGGVGRVASALLKDGKPIYNLRCDLKQS